MKRLLLTISLCLIYFLSPLQAQSPKHEVRAAWVTVVYGLDWPRSKATTQQGVRQQKAELIEILDKLHAANFNTVLFQTRLRGELVYPSPIEPMSSILTNKVNGDPGYDPLQFAIEECHKRGMELHAWIVAIPLGGKRHHTTLGAQSVTKKKRNLCVTYKNEHFLNPGNPDTKEYLLNITKEIVSRYDVDGVHYDYLRYPEHARNFPDKYDFQRYAKGRTLAQWRRDNLTDIVRHLYNGVKQLKPWVKVSTCPVGKYGDLTRYSSRGWNAIDAVYQDPQGWLGEGIQDQIYPMMYYKKDNFYPFALDWQEQSNGRHVVPGLGIYFLDPSEGNWTRDEVDRQLNFIRHTNMAGAGHYRVEFLMKNSQGLYDELKENHYAHPALQPAMPWLDNVAPSAPTQLKVTKNRDGYTQLSWNASTDNDKGNAPRYTVYASNSYPVDITKAENIIATQVVGTTYIYSSILPWKEYTHFAVTAIDRYGNESKAIQSK